MLILKLISNVTIDKNLGKIDNCHDDQTNPAGNYMFKVNNRSTRTRCEICSKLTIKTPERRQWHRSGVFNY